MYILNTFKYSVSEIFSIMYINTKRSGNKLQYGHTVAMAYRVQPTFSCYFTDRLVG